METATRYLHTIESLMIDNSRLKKELNEAVKGKLPSRIVPVEEVEKCFGIIASVLGPTSRGDLLNEVTIICNEFKNVSREYVSAASTMHALEKEKSAAIKAVKGDDIDDNYSSSRLVNDVVRLRAVLEVIKTRLDRLCSINTNTELSELRKDVVGFLSNRD
jgi:hypothetical protein